MIFPDADFTGALNQFKFLAGTVIIYFGKKGLLKNFIEIEMTASHLLRICFGTALPGRGNDGFVSHNFKFPKRVNFSFEVRTLLKNNKTKNLLGRLQYKMTEYACYFGYFKLPMKPIQY